MLEKSTRKKLLEHKWKDMLQKDSNPSITRSRIKDQAIAALDDLALIAYECHKGNLDEIFNESTIK